MNLQALEFSAFQVLSVSAFCLRENRVEAVVTAAALRNHTALQRLSFSSPGTLTKDEASFAFPSCGYIFE
jgi:hypothetical protein